MEKDTTLKEALQENKDLDQVRLSQFKTIADTLLSIEYHVPWVGIPFLPKSSERDNLYKDFFYPDTDYFRSSLVTVQSAILVEASDALKKKNIIYSEAFNFLANIRNLKIIDKLAFPLLSGVIVVILCYSSLSPFSMEEEKRIMASLVSGIGSMITASLFYIEEVRFFFFTKLLDQEILRRSGKLPNSKFPEISVKAYSRLKNT